MKGKILARLTTASNATYLTRRTTSVKDCHYSCGLITNFPLMKCPSFTTLTRKVVLNKNADVFFLPQTAFCTHAVCTGAGLSEHQAWRE